VSEIGTDLKPILTSPAFIVLALLSIYSIALMMNQAFYLYVNRERAKEVFDFLEDGGKSEKDVESFAAGGKSPHRRLIRAGLKHAGKSDETLVALLGEEIKALRWEAEQRLAALGTIANIAPFIGLFGTVVGVIRAFHAISIKMGAGPSVVAAGIAEALITTAAGLFVAIPAVVAYNFFLKRVRRLTIEMERVATLLIHRARS
jgi:biopolymer transport protein ExbB/TolQ